jgi:hypothetical protein
MEDGATIFLIGLGGFLLGRAIWQSFARRRHLAWIAAISGPIGLLGIVIDQVWPFIVGAGLFAVGEFLYQTNDEISPARFKELREDVQKPNSRRPRRTRPSGDTSSRHNNIDPNSGGQS